MFPPDLVGSADQILSQLHDDPIVAQVGKLRLELPYHFAQVDHEQILADTLRHIAPALGWQPGGPARGGPCRAGGGLSAAAPAPPADGRCRSSRSAYPSAKSVVGRRAVAP